MTGRRGDLVIPLPEPMRLRSSDLFMAGIAGLCGRPLRVVLSALGVSIGIAAMVAVLGISAVGTADLVAKLDCLGTNLLTVTAGRSLGGEDVELPGGPEVEGMIERIPGVQSASAVGQVNGATVRRTDKVNRLEANGVMVAAAREDLLETLKATVRSGTFLNAATGRYPAVVLGSVAARRLGVDRAGTNEQVYIAGRWFTVIGVLDDDGGGNRDRRQLKQREPGEVQPVPCPPELTALLHEHMAAFGTAPDGRLFVGERNGTELPKLTIVRAWQRARQAVFTEEVAATPLGRTPYDLRHAAVSTWLNGGVPPATVAAWAGHSVEILLKIYAKCLDGGDEVIRRRVQAALGHTSG